MKPEDKTLNLYDYTYEDLPILDLKRWVDKQIELGNNSIRLEISWDFYSDIDAIEIFAKK